MCEKCKVIRRRGAVLVICQNPATSRGRAEAPDGTDRRRQRTHGQAAEVASPTSRDRPSTAQEILAEVGVDPDTKVKDLTDDEVIKLREAVEAHPVEGDLRRERSQNVKRLMEIGSYRGLRHRRGLPAGPADQDQRAQPQGPAPDERRRQAQGADPEVRDWLMAPKKSAKGRSRRRVKKNVPYGQAHIKTSFNNTIVTLTDPEGNVLAGSRAAAPASRARASRPRSPPR